MNFLTLHNVVLFRNVIKNWFFNCIILLMNVQCGMTGILYIDVIVMLPRM